MADIRQSPEYAKYLRSQGWTVERLAGTNYALRKLPLVGYILKLQRPVKLDFKQLEKLQNKYRIFQTLVEPLTKKQAGGLESRGYHVSKSPYLPTKTLRLNLRPSIQNLLANCDKDTRYCLRKTKDIHIFTDPGLASFHKAWQIATGWSRIVPSMRSLASLKKYYRSNIIFASHNGNGTRMIQLPITANSKKKIRAGAIFIKSGNTVYYWQAFTSPAGRSSLSQYAIVWYGILWAKRVGATYFDFEGVFDDRFPNKSWQGFTKFKEGFGGKTILYPETYTSTQFRSSRY